MIVSAARQYIASLPGVGQAWPCHRAHGFRQQVPAPPVPCDACALSALNLNVRMMRRTEALASKVGRHVALTGSSQTPLPTSALLLPLLAALGI